MFKIIMIILFTCVVMCMGLPQDQEPVTEDRHATEEPKYELESRQDFDRTSEKEKEMRLLRKAKKQKETNYRRALDSILPAKSSQSYRRLFEEFLNSSKEQFRSPKTSKEIEEVVVTDTFLDDNESEGRDGEPQVEEIEVVIEHITDDDNAKDTIDRDNEPSPVTENPSLYESNDEEDPSRNGGVESVEREQQLEDFKVDEDVKGRTAEHDSSVEMNAMHMGNMARRTVIESYPVSRVSGMVIPHYRTALSRSGVMVSPTVYTVKTSAPIVDHVTTRSWVSNRPILPEMYGRSGPTDRETKFIDDYKDYGRNNYRYSPSRSLFAQRQGDNLGILPKFPGESFQPQLGIMKPLRDTMHPGTFYSQPQRFYPNNLRPMFFAN